MKLKMSLLALFIIVFTNTKAQFTCTIHNTSRITSSLNCTYKITVIVQGKATPDVPARKYGQTKNIVAGATAVFSFNIPHVSDYELKVINAKTGASPLLKNLDLNIIDVRGGNCFAPAVGGVTIWEPIDVSNHEYNISADIVSNGKYKYHPNIAFRKNTISK
jgi:hypothetical protein